MTPVVEKGKPGSRADQGLSLIETLVALSIMLVVMSGLAPLMVVGIRSTDVNQRQVELLIAARAKLEEIQSIPYQQVGIIPGGGAPAPGYFEKDALYNPTYNPATDLLLSDTIALSFGTQATRTVTVEAIDDPVDATGAADWDKVIDPNTGAIQDYKLVRVVAQATDPASNITLTQELSTIVRGLLDSEIDGATGGGDPAGAAPPPKGKKPKADKTKKAEPGAGHPQPPEGDGEGRKDKSKGTDD